MNEKHVGRDFADFLREEGSLAEVEAVAARRVLAYQISEAMKEQELSNSAMARRIGTSRSSLDRLLDPEVSSVTLLTWSGRLSRSSAAAPLWRQVVLEALFEGAGRGAPDPGGIDEWKRWCLPVPQEMTCRMHQGVWSYRDRCFLENTVY